MPLLKIVATHLLISIVVVSTAIILIVFLWYPDIYAQTENFYAILWLIAGVNICLGPVLTAIVFKPQKKSLKFDLSVIALLQISALIYGLNILFVARPVFIVFNIDRLTVVSAVGIPDNELKKAPKNYQTFSYSGPVLVGSQLPDNPKERSRLLNISISSHIDLPQLPQYYVPFAQITDEVKKSLKSLDSLTKRKPELKPLIASALQDLNISENEVGFLPVLAKSHDSIALVQRNNAQIIKYLAIDSW